MPFMEWWWWKKLLLYNKTTIIGFIVYDWIKRNSIKVKYIFIILDL